MHRVVITAILLAAKFFDDAYYNNAYYSKVGGVLVSEMNGLEVDFLFRINFSLHVTPEVFEKYKAELVAHSAGATAAVPPAPTPTPQPLPETYQNTIPMETSATQLHAVPSAPIPMPAPVTHHAPPHVTPSPSQNRNVSVPVAAAPVVPTRVDPNPCPQPMYVSEQLFNSGIPEQLIQRANSLPVYPSHTGRCLENNPPYSAPMVSMLPNGGGEDPYAIVTNQVVFPLQTTLVHHHHGVENYQEQPGFHHSQHGAAYPIGSLAVAGHY